MCEISRPIGNEGRYENVNCKPIFDSAFAQEICLLTFFPVLILSVKRKQLLLESNLSRFVFSPDILLVEITGFKLSDDESSIIYKPHKFDEHPGLSIFGI